VRFRVGALNRALPSGQAAAQTVHVARQTSGCGRKSGDTESFGLTLSPRPVFNGLRVGRARRLYGSARRVKVWLIPTGHKAENAAKGIASRG
jgi:hypothetical protein